MVSDRAFNSPDELVRKSTPKFSPYSDQGVTDKGAISDAASVIKNVGKWLCELCNVDKKSDMLYCKGSFLKFIFQSNQVKRLTPRQSLQQMENQCLAERLQMM